MEIIGSLGVLVGLLLLFTCLSKKLTLSSLRLLLPAWSFCLIKWIQPQPYLEKNPTNLWGHSPLIFSIILLSFY
ncbi:Uncharacterised protein [Streptococcus pyogenes]|nr:Uncharacterised protein [Streptococcus pyogenes]VGW56383.1 Uncharacterised protein [Streptococcus pyogenes]VHF90397.1 Uncharacterised protein [Streptococcus pyogenes]VHL10875.1 Uncharacterised protein [Streptococcus pyogenes]VHL86137.1 Uncharacterised protein [Streptococcus pyogenes]